jgi:hypothetical protein
LIEQLHEDMVSGTATTSYDEMETDKLVDLLMDEVVENQREMFTQSVPFGIQAMVKADRELWLGES